MPLTLFVLLSTLQGCLCHSTWFAGALAAISTQQQLLLNLIVSDDHADQGLYTFRFFKHGAWRQVVVDNRLPCMKLQQRLAYTSSGTPQVRDSKKESFNFCAAATTVCS